MLNLKFTVQMYLLFQSFLRIVDIFQELLLQRLFTAFGSSKFLLGIEELISEFLPLRFCNE